MTQSTLITFVGAAAVIAALVLWLASTRKSLSGPIPLPSGRTLGDGRYPSDFWMTIGIAAGIGMGLLLGSFVQTLVGGMSIGLGVGLILGKLLTQRFDKDTRQYTEEQKQERLHRASCGLIVMILLVLATLLAALLPLLGWAEATGPSPLGFSF